MCDLGRFIVRHNPDRNHVNAAGGLGRKTQPTVIARKPEQFFLLACIYFSLRQNLHVGVLALHFNEYDRITFAGNYVYLAKGATKISLNDCIIMPDEIFAGKVLSEGTEYLTLKVPFNRRCSVKYFIQPAEQRLAL